MKTLHKLFSIGAMAFLFMLMAPHKSMAQDDGYVSDQEFYDDLQQYGTWVQDDQYGDVWVPDVDGDFRPYATNGYWIQTDYGTTWVSGYPWGWATFHYGRWRYDDYYGWEWIPGHEWAPAWVSWRQGGGYYGWAPMGPGISITISLGGIGLSLPDSYWIYAPARYITSRYVYRYYTPHARIANIIRHTTYIHNTYVYNKRTYITGPRPADIQKITRQKVNVYKINNANRPGSLKVGINTVNIYRPVIKKTPNARPVRVVSGTAYKNEHPTAGIGQKGTPGYNHGNAAKLASTARSSNPNSNVVKVFPRKSNEPNKPNEPVAHPAAPVGNKPAQPSRAEEGKDHHRSSPVPAQPVQQPAVNKPAGQQPANNAPTQPAPVNGSKGHHHRPTPAVTPAGQQQEEQQQQARQQKEQELKQQQEAKQQAAQQQKEQQQQAQQAARQQQQEAKQQAQQQQRQQQQAAQQAARQQQQQARQAAEQQKQQQQAAQQAARQQQQQQARQAAEQARQQAQQQKQQEEQQKREQQQKPPLK